MDLVTCAITTHKRKPEIVERALKSILNQTYKNIEVFVVDDSPSEWEFRNDVRTMVEGYSDKNVTYIPHDKCMGACVARNTALEHATGKYIGFLDDDDEWKPEKVEKMIAAFTNDDIALVYCNRESIYDDLDKVEIQNPSVFTGMVFDSLIMKNYIGSTSFPILKTAYLKEIGGFDPLMQSAQDYDVWLRLAEKYQVAYVDQSLCRYHLHKGEQITKNPLKQVAGLKRLMEKNSMYLSKYPDAYRSRAFEIMPCFVRAKKYGQALSVWFKAVLKRPFKFKSNFYNLYLFFAMIIVAIRDRNK